MCRVRRFEFGVTHESGGGEAVGRADRFGTSHRVANGAVVHTPQAVVRVWEPTGEWLNGKPAAPVKGQRARIVKVCIAEARAVDSLLPIAIAEELGFFLRSPSLPLPLGEEWHAISDAADRPTASDAPPTDTGAPRAAGSDPESHSPTADGQRDHGLGGRPTFALTAHLP